jgi:O-antigen ligase
LDTGDVVLMGEYIRRGSTIGPSTFTAPVFVILYGILVAVIKNNRAKILLSIILLIGVFLTGTRAALLVVLISFLFLFLFIPFKRKIVILVVILFFAPYLDEKFNIYNTIQSRNTEASSAGGDLSAGRVVRWKFTLDILKTDPELFFFGTGGANTPYFNRFRETNIRSVASPHNVYLSFLFEHGIFGFLSFLCFLLYLLKTLKNKKSMSYYIFLLTILITFNTEVIPRAFEFSFVLFLLYFISYQKSAIQ